VKPGTVFKWNNFPFPRFGGQGKPRWFIYLGNTGKILTPTIAYIQTTTSKITSYQTGGPKVNHDYLLLRAINTPFEKDCIIDFSIQPIRILKLAETYMKIRLDQFIIKLENHHFIPVK